MKMRMTILNLLNGWLLWLDKVELEDLREAAAFNTETYRILKDTDGLISTIILPKHIR
jgi:hypothetical protein